MAAVLYASVMGVQTAKPQAAPKAHQVVPTKSKLTAQQQEGLKILKTEADVAKGLSPAMRSFALLEIAQGYRTVHDPKAVSTLRGAFQASQSIEDNDENKSTKSLLQGQIVRQLVVQDPAYCERLLSQLSGLPRKVVITALMKKYTQEKQFAHAVALLNQLGDEEFPYTEGSRLAEALPAKMAADRQNLFAQALSSYSQHQHKSNSDEFEVFVSRTWQSLPPDMVLQAIDEILKQERESDTKMGITVGAAQGAVSFGSTYQYALFQMLPILQELDPGRADQLLQENHDLQSTVQHFPNGFKSLDSKAGIPDSITMRSPDSGGSTAEDRYPPNCSAVQTS